MSDPIPLNVIVTGAHRSDLQTLVDGAGGALLPTDRDLAQVIEVIANSAVLVAALVELAVAARALRKKGEEETPPRAIVIRLETADHGVDLATATEADITELAGQILAARQT